MFKVINRAHARFSLRRALALGWAEGPANHFLLVQADHDITAGRYDGRAVRDRVNFGVCRRRVHRSYLLAILGN